MAITTERKLVELENDLKSLKATYSISGGLMELFESTSPVYTENTVVEARVRFTPTYGGENGVIISSIYYDYKDENNVHYNFSQYVYIEPETGDGNIYFRMPTLGGTFQIKIVSTAPGTFTRLS